MVLPPHSPHACTGLRRPGPGHLSLGTQLLFPHHHHCELPTPPLPSQFLPAGPRFCAHPTHLMPCPRQDPPSPDLHIAPLTHLPPRSFLIPCHHLKPLCSPAQSQKPRRAEAGRHLLRSSRPTPHQSRVTMARCSGASPLLCTQVLS